ncbi:MAG: type II toxin-antitoxin system MqsA family antitoxin [Acidobacteria bacterium]|nr:type II toxin-antitoxin system MqsA family antitoxin [Acidobacteriota bacterium]MBI3421677.1 type II toxin-antitoxin system MqsA family antitoxin [Acidobacteriota bacterium]
MNDLKAKNQKLRGQTKAMRVCSFCGQLAAREVYKPQLFERDQQWLVVEQVPTMVCGNCGETYFTGGTLEELERILDHQAELTTLRPVLVAQFSQAA